MYEFIRNAENLSSNFLAKMLLFRWMDNLY